MLTAFQTDCFTRAVHVKGTETNKAKVSSNHLKGNLKSLLANEVTN